MTNWTSLHSNAFTGKRALVTGGAGFIGSHLTRALVALGAKVTVIDDLVGTFGSWDNLDGVDVTRVQASILDAKAVAHATTNCDFVFHLAALGSVPGSVNDPRRYVEVNVTGTLNVLEAA